MCMASDRVGRARPRRNAAAAVLGCWALLAGCGPPAPVSPADAGALAPGVRRVVEERLEAARAAPGDAAAHGSLGLAYEANDLWGEAAASFANAAELDPDEPLWRYHRAIALRQLGDADGALALFSDVVAARPDSAAFQHRLAEELRERGDLDGALVHYRRAAELAPARPEGPVGEASILVERGDCARAAELLEHALTLDPSYRRTHYLLGLAYRGLGHEDEAAAQLALGLESSARQIPDELEPERFRYIASTDARLERAIRLSEGGRPQRALAILKGLLAAEPGNVTILNDLAATYLRLGETEAAHELLTHGLELDANQPFTHINMASCLAAMGMTAQALGHAERAVELAPGLAAAHLERGRVLAQQHRDEEAHASLAEAVRLDPSMAEARSLLAEACMATGREDEALEQRRALARLEPVDLRAQLALGKLALERGEREIAAAALAAAERIAPDDPEVRELRRLLEG